MALTNFSTSFGAFTSHNWAATAATVSPLQPHHVSAVNNLLYGPAGHQQQDNDNEPPGYYKNNPYSFPSQSHQQQQHQSTTQYRYNRPKTNNNYLPPHLPSVATNLHHQQQQQPQQTFSIQSPQSASSTFSSRGRNIRYQYNNHNHQNHTLQQEIESGTYLPVPVTKKIDTLNYGDQQQQQQQPQYIQHGSGGYQTDQYDNQQNLYPPSSVSSILPPVRNPEQSSPDNYGRDGNYDGPNRNISPPQQQPSLPSPTVPPATSTSKLPNDNNNLFPGKPPGFTRVTSGQGANTRVHAILDYDIEDGEDYYDVNDEGTAAINQEDNRTNLPTVTPIQGPIFLKNDSVPVVPLLSYPTVNNGTFVQIPIWWTALSVALGLDISGDVIRGVPCIKRFHQLFCPTAGNSYPIDKIERFIDDNKALMRRMYGDFEVTNEYGPPKQQNRRVRRYLDDPDIFLPPGALPSRILPNGEPELDETGDTYFGKLRKKRQSSNANNRNNNKNNNNNKNFGRGGPKNIPNSPNDSSTGRVDACESKIEIVTPYWASNSAGKIRAIVNTQHFEQAIHQEICTKVQTTRCGNDCGCEQKYKWHRLLAYDPDNDCKGIFMDWFLFPSCCVCRCNP